MPHPSFTLVSDIATRRVARASRGVRRVGIDRHERTAGATPGDYSFTVEGELVTPLAAECASGERYGSTETPGLASGFATTTAMVVDRPGVTEDDLRDAVFDWLDRAG